MKVRKLIEKLSKLNPNAEVRYVWDGDPRGFPSHVWVAKSGTVMLCDESEYVSNSKDAPEGLNVGDRVPYSFLTGRQCAMHFNKSIKSVDKL